MEKLRKEVTMRESSNHLSFAPEANAKASKLRAKRKIEKRLHKDAARGDCWLKCSKKRCDVF